MHNYTSVSTSSLRLNLGVLKNRKERCSAFLSETTDHADPVYIDAVTQLDDLGKEIQAVSEEIEKRADKLVYSIEDVYRVVGQSDSYCAIDFFYKSPAYDKYGATVHGKIWYKKPDREVLDNAIKQSNYQRSNGIVYLDSGTDDDAVRNDLRTVGFEAVDIKTLYLVGSPNEKMYKQPGVKKIPHTINIKIDKTFDVVAAQQYVLKNYHCRWFPIAET